MKIIRNSLEHGIYLELISENIEFETKFTKCNEGALTVWNKREVQSFLKATQVIRYFIVFYLALVTREYDKVDC
ncbi:DNA integration/recombination/inversion protein [Bacillus dicomae]|uniref:DNA integration/recombination/inversion protein n=1 Tax=Bacillus dicomae TaxID=3088378 RepID=A0AC61SZN3_9BACI|nr:DNA integration/recombination/inversion protein [Bacillus dicomae]